MKEIMDPEIKAVGETIAEQIRSKYGRGWTHIGETAQQNAIAAAVFFEAMNLPGHIIDAVMMRRVYEAVVNEMGK